MSELSAKRAFSKISFLLYVDDVEDEKEHIAEQYLPSLLDDHDSQDVAELINEEPSDRLSGWFRILERAMQNGDNLDIDDSLLLIEEGLKRDDEECRYFACRYAISMEEPESDTLLRAHIEEEDDEVIIALIEEHLVLLDNRL